MMRIVVDCHYMQGFDARKRNGLSLAYTLKCFLFSVIYELIRVIIFFQLDINQYCIKHTVSSFMFSTKLTHVLQPRESFTCYHYLSDTLASCAEIIYLEGRLLYKNLACRF